MAARLLIEAPQLRELFRADFRLVRLLERALEVVPCSEMALTSLARTRERDKELHGSGVHADGPPWRAADIVGAMSQEEYEQTAMLLNSEWDYDATRPNLGVAVGREHGTGPHLHLQVHPRTQKREDP